MASGVCCLCDRERHDITRHHLIPRTTHKNKWVKERFLITTLRETVAMCKPCHKQIHVLISEKDMAKTYNTVEDLKAHPEVAKWIDWVKDKTF